MSVLFEALKKNTRPSRDAQEQSIPMITLSAGRRLGFSPPMIVLLVAVVAGISALCGYALKDSFASQPVWTSAPAPVRVAQAAPAVQNSKIQVAANVSSDSVAEVSKKINPQPHSRVVADEPQGIALPAEALVLPDTAAEKTRDEIAQQLTQTPALNGGRSARAAGAQTGRASIVVEARGRGASAATGWGEADQRLQDKDYAGALDVYNRILATSGRDDKAWRGKVYVLEMMGSSDAVAELERMAAGRGESGLADAALARLYEKQGQRDMAIAKWWHAIGAEPGADAYRLSLGILFDRMGDGDRALSLYEQVKGQAALDLRRRIDYLKGIAPVDQAATAAISPDGNL